MKHFAVLVALALLIALVGHLDQSAALKNAEPRSHGLDQHPQEDDSSELADIELAAPGPSITPLGRDA